MKISYVVYLINGNMCLNVCGEMCFCVGICDMTLSDFSVNYSGCGFCICDCENVILTGQTCACPCDYGEMWI